MRMVWDGRHGAGRNGITVAMLGMATGGAALAGNRNALFVQIIILVVLGALKRELQGEAVLGDLVDPHVGGDFHSPE